MRKIFAFLFIFAFVFLTACAPEEEKENPSLNEPPKENVELSLWTYPVGGWTNAGSVSSILASFHRENPNIRVTFKAIDYETGDSEVEEALKNKTGPDIILEGPERLVANWGARGLMVDLSDLFEDEHSQKIYENVLQACRGADQNYYIYPLCMTTHCMAINRDLFEAAGAWQYVDEETHTWSTDDFIRAVEALSAYGMEEVAAIYCGGQGGDQGTRALVNNLYSGVFTDAQHTKYTVDSEENIRALELLQSLDGIVFDPDLVGTTEVEKFIEGDLAMAFCWNVSMEINQIMKNPDLDFDIFPMAFPTNDGDFNLQGGIWGFGIFDQGDEAKVEAAKTFIRYLTQEESVYERAVLTSTFWPVLDMPQLYVNDKLMIEYGIFQQHMGDYYQVTPGWTEARTAWWQMLQKIGAGAEVRSAVHEFSEQVNSFETSGES